MVELKEIIKFKQHKDRTEFWLKEQKQSKPMYLWDAGLAMPLTTLQQQIQRSATEAQERATRARLSSALGSLLGR